MTCVDSGSDCVSFSLTIMYLSAGFVSLTNNGEVQGFKPVILRETISGLKLSHSRPLEWGNPFLSNLLAYRLVVSVTTLLHLDGRKRKAS